MDSIKGAILLRDRFDRQGIQGPERPETQVPSDALPIFHWLAAEPEPAPRESS